MSLKSNLSLWAYCVRSFHLCIRRLKYNNLFDFNRTLQRAYCNMNYCENGRTTRKHATWQSCHHPTFQSKYKLLHSNKLMTSGLDIIWAKEIHQVAITFCACQKNLALWFKQLSLFLLKFVLFTEVELFCFNLNKILFRCKWLNMNQLNWPVTTVISETPYSRASWIILHKHTFVSKKLLWVLNFLF